jgi:hypothetical protein
MRRWRGRVAAIPPGLKSSTLDPGPWTLNLSTKPSILTRECTLQYGVRQPRAGGAGIIIAQKKHGDMHSQFSNPASLPCMYPIRGFASSVWSLGFVLGFSQVPCMALYIGYLALAYVSTSTSNPQPSTLNPQPGTSEDPSVTPRTASSNHSQHGADHMNNAIEFARVAQVLSPFSPSQGDLCKLEWAFLGCYFPCPRAAHVLSLSSVLLESMRSHSRSDQIPMP